jgi:hypothetical protein
MILTKTEFSKEFKFNNLSSVSHLISSGKIKVNGDGLIDTNQKENKAWVKNRRSELRKQNKEKKEVQQAKEKTSSQLSLEIDLLNARLDEKRQKSELAKIKIAQAKKEVIEVAVLNRVLIMTFDDLFKNLLEFPASYASDIVDIVKANENPKEKLVDFLTEHITSNLKNGLENARKAAKKYYE